jgi:hypothetical protein
MPKLNQIMVQSEQRLSNILEKTKNNAQDGGAIFDALTEFYSTATEDESILLEKSVNSANVTFSSTGYQYTPETENIKSKSINGCDKCTALSSVVVRSCENYGLIDTLATTDFTANCNRALFTTVRDPVKNLVYKALNTTGFQNIATELQICAELPLYKLTVEEGWSPEALCQCTAINIVQEASISINESIGYTTDFTSLYGDSTNAPQWQGIKTHTNTTVISGTASATKSDLFVKIIDAVKKARQKSKCPLSQLTILVNPSLEVDIASLVDNNDRPIYDPNTSSLNFSFGTVKVVPMEAVKYILNTTTNNYETDIFVGNFKHYGLKKYLANSIMDIYDFTAGSYKMQYLQYGVGAVLKNSFVVLEAKISA